MLYLHLLSSPYLPSFYAEGTCFILDIYDYLNDQVTWNVLLNITLVKIIIVLIPVHAWVVDERCRYGCG